MLTGHYSIEDVLIAIVFLYNNQVWPLLIRRVDSHQVMILYLNPKMVIGNVLI